MTNKDYSYLDELLKEVILVLFNNLYHKGLNNQRRIERVQKSIDELSKDEKEYIQSRTVQYFEELKGDHKKNMARKR